MYNFKKHTNKLLLPVFALFVLFAYQQTMAVTVSYVSYGASSKFPERIPQIMPSFDEGTEAVLDRPNIDTKWINIPSEVLGSPWLKTARFDKYSYNTLATPVADDEALYTVSTDGNVTVYVTITTINGCPEPTWISADGWVSSGLSLDQTSIDLNVGFLSFAYSLYKKDFAAGDVPLKRQTGNECPGTAFIFGGATGSGVESKIELGQGLKINAFPNPMRSTTQITFSGKLISKNATISIFNIRGENVQKWVLREGNLKDGFNWNVANHPMGTYLVKLIDGPKTLSKKIVVIK